MSRFTLGAEELIELGRAVPLARSGGAPVLVELGRRCTTPGAPSAGMKPFFMGRPRTNERIGLLDVAVAPEKGPWAAAGIGVAAFAAAILFS